MGQAARELLEATSEGEHTAVAILLVLDELARSDSDFDARERSTIEACLTTSFAVDPGRLDVLMASVEAARSGSADLVRLSRVIKTRLPAQHDRDSVAKALWQVVLADGEVTDVEDRLVNSITTLIGVSYKRVSELKAEILDRT